VVDAVPNPADPKYPKNAQLDVPEDVLLDAFLADHGNTEQDLDIAVIVPVPRSVPRSADVPRGVLRDVLRDVPRDVPRDVLMEFARLDHLKAVVV